MHDLTVTGVEDGSLLLSSHDGSTFRVPIDERLTSTIRGAASAPAGTARRIPPREIQAHIRAGMSAADVAAITGASLEYIERFEGPVLAEREYVIESALNVAVHTALDLDPLSSGSTFGAVIRDRLHDLGASGERWASWKDAEGGWIVKLSFTANEIDHDARWRYEPKKSALAPINTEAHTLSQQGELPGGLIPRLRAVGSEERSADSSRFDSGAFDVRAPAGDLRDSGSFGRSAESSPEVSAAAITRAPIDEIETSQTADLLEALRRRRGERESAASWDEDAMADHPASGGAGSTGRIRLVDVPLETFDSPPFSSGPIGGSPDAGPDDRGAHADTPLRDTAPQGFAAQAKGGSSKRGRAAMPSWDEIVFGARSDDDLA